MTLTLEKAKALREWLDNEIKNLEKEQVITEPWHPPVGRWLITLDGTVMEIPEFESRTGWRLFGLFRSEATVAKKAAEEIRIHNRLLAYRDEFEPGYIFNPGTYNAFVYHNGRGWVHGTRTCSKTPGVVYMGETTASYLAEQLNAGLVEL